MTDLAPIVTISAHRDGDDTRPAVRLVVAPAPGIFEPTVSSAGPTHVPVGGEIGRVLGPGRTEPVRSFCAGSLVRLLAEPGERVRNHQPLAWLEPVAAPMRPTST